MLGSEAATWQCIVFKPDAPGGVNYRFAHACPRMAQVVQHALFAAESFRAKALLCELLYGKSLVDIHPIDSSPKLDFKGDISLQWQGRAELLQCGVGGWVNQRPGKRGPRKLPQLFAVRVCFDKLG